MTIMYDIRIEININKKNCDKEIEIIITQNSGHNMIYKTCDQIMQLQITIASITVTTIKTNE